MIDSIIFPKIVSSNEYSINNDEYLEYSFQKKGNKYYLYKNDNFSNNIKSFWLVNDVASKIKRKEKDCIFIILAQNNERDIEVLLGNSFDLENMDYFSKFTISQENFEKNCNTLNRKIKVAIQLFNYKKNLIVYNYNLEEDTCKGIIENKYSLRSKKDLESILFSAKLTKQSFNKYFPYVAILFLVSLLYVAGYFNITTSIDEENKKFEQDKNKIHKKLNLIKKDNMALKKEISSLEKVITQNKGIINSIYRGEK